MRLLKADRQQPHLRVDAGSGLFFDVWIREEGVLLPLLTGSLPGTSYETAICRSPKQCTALPEQLHGRRMTRAGANGAMRGQERKKE
jgi:hypothetical protein